MNRIDQLARVRTALDRAEAPVMVVRERALDRSAV